MPVTASGPLSLPFQFAAFLLASSATFRALAGAADATEALESICFPFRDVETDGYQIPGAIICHPDGAIQFRERMGREAGKLCLILSAAIPEEFVGDPQNDYLDWLNKCGAILNEMLNNAGTPTGSGNFYWRMTGYTLIAAGWGEQSEQSRDEEPTAAADFRLATFGLDWV